VTRILLVEDDLDLGGVLAQFLALSGFEATHAATGRRGLEAFEREAPALCILDVGLPDLDGFEVAARMKAQRPDVPFLFLTARTLKADRLRGLELGADDYILKPFEADELVLRIRNILRRQGALEDEPLRLGAYRFQPETRLLEREGEGQVLSRREADLLALLAEHRNRVVRRSEILERIWGKEDYFTGRSLDVFITRLRKCLGGDGELRIEAVRGTGFVLRTPDQVIPAAGRGNIGESQAGPCT
jgi:DNA-binding response OmpR family regulator